MSRARVWDIATASPLVALYVLALYGFGLELYRDFAQLSDPIRAGAMMVSHLTAAIFVCTQIVLFFVRRLPLARSRGIAPAAYAIAGANSGLLFYILPRATTYPSLLSAAIIALGMSASIFVLCHLGRAFSILPQARVLVTSGPYRIIRHPLYVAETIAGLGVMLQFVQPWSLLVFLFGIALQLRRMIYEERILLQAFAEYRTYAASTARIVPGIF